VTSDRPHPSPLRRLPLPCSEPPFDDELGPVPADWPPRRPTALGAPGSPGVRGSRAAPGNLVGQVDLAVQGTLALAFVLPSGLPAVPEPPPGLHLIANDTGSPDEFGPRPTGRAALPAPRTWAARVVQAIVEVLSGVRPATQLVRWTTEEVYEQISARVLAGRGGDVDGPPRGVVRSLHVSEPADGVAEVCALVRRGARSTAVALRLEGMDGRWQCTAIELG
jgi:Family of unknown function (DUF6459)